MMRRIAVAACAVLLIAPFALAGSASASDKVVREAVVSKLAPDGAVESTTVAQLIHLEAAGDETVELHIPKVDELSSYRNLSGFSGTSGEDDDIVWKTSDELTARSLARFDGKLPIEVNVRYFLDGAEVSAKDIKRRSGDVRIEVQITNVSGETKNLEHKAVTSPFLTSFVNQFIPMEYAVRVEFPTDRWSKVGGDGVRVASDRGNEIASSSGILSPPLTDESKTVVFEGRSEDILTPRLQVFAVPGLSDDFVNALQEQFEALQALYDGTGSINENLGKIYDGTVALVDGVEEMLNGVGENADGQPVVDLGTDGLPTTLLGTLGFLSEALNGQILPGIGEVDPDTGEGVIVKDADGKTTTLIGALQSQKGTYDEKLIPGMQTLIDGMDQLIAGIEDGAPALVDGLGALQDGLELLLGSLQTDDPNDPGFREGLLALAGGMDALLANLQTDDANNPGFREGLLAISGGLSTLLANLQTDDPNNPGFREGLLGVSGGLASLLAGLQSGDVNSPGLVEGLETIQQSALDAQTAFAGLDPAAAAVFGQLAGGIGQVLLSVGDSGDPPTDQTIIGAVQLLSGGMSQLVAGLGDNSDPPSDQTIIGAIQLMVGGLGQLVAGLGDVADAPNDQTIIGAIELMNAGLGQLTAGLGDANDPASPTTVIGALELVLGGLEQAGPGAGSLVDSVLGALDQMHAGLTNPEFTQEQDALDGQTPKEYFADCPACFDPDSDRYDEATADPSFQPSFLEVFNLFSEGIEDALPSLDSLDDDAPGLVDGLQQVAGGIDALAAALHTGDPDAPGLVDGLDLARGGLQQVSSGLFALNELGIRTMRGQIGDQGDAVAGDQANLVDAANRAASDSAIDADADVVSATYVFDLAAQSTASNDNLRRGALMGFALLGTALLTRRVRRFVP